MRCFVVSPSKLSPTLLALESFDSPIVDISSSDEYSLFLTEKNSLYIAYGDNAPIRWKLNTHTFHICYGCGKKAIATCELCKVDICRACSHSKKHAFHGTIEYEPPLVNGIYCGSSHSYILYNNRNVMVFGKNICGQLCLGHRFFVTIPEAIPRFTEFHIKTIASGRNHVIFVTNDKKRFKSEDVLYICGSGVFGQLGSSSYENLEYSKDNLRNISTIVLNKTNRERNPPSKKKDEETEGEEEEEEEEARIMSQKEKIMSKLMGGGTAQVNRTTRIISNQKFGETSPVILDDAVLRNKTIKQVSCGENYTIILTSDDELYGFGDNRSGQLGLLNERDIVNTPTLLNPRGRGGGGEGTSFGVADDDDDNSVITKIACGDSHTIVATERNVFVCGSNEASQLLGMTFYDENDNYATTSSSTTTTTNSTTIDLLHHLLPKETSLRRKKTKIRRFVRYEGFENERVLDISCGKFFSAVVTTMTQIMTKEERDREERLKEKIRLFMSKKGYVSSMETKLMESRIRKKLLLQQEQKKKKKNSNDDVEEEEGKKRVFRVHFFGGPFLSVTNNAIETERRVVKVSCQKDLFYFLCE